MILYHGSRHKLDTLREQQAQAGEGVQVPEGELLKAIYLTPDRGFAIAMAVNLAGLITIDHTARSIEFEHPELFDPKRKIYLYEVDTETLKPDQVREIDERQYAVIDVPEITPTSVEELKAGDVEQYYELKNWKREGDVGMTGEDFRSGSRK